MTWNLQYMSVTDLWAQCESQSWRETNTRGHTLELLWVLLKVQTEGKKLHQHAFLHHSQLLTGKHISSRTRDLQTRNKQDRAGSSSDLCMYSCKFACTSQVHILHTWHTEGGVTIVRNSLPLALNYSHRWILHYNAAFSEMRNTFCVNTLIRYISKWKWMNQAAIQFNHIILAELLQYFESGCLISDLKYNAHEKTWRI